MDASNPILNVNSTCVLQQNNEEAPLLQKAQRDCCLRLVRKYLARNKMCLSSKSAILILFWSFLVGLLNWLVITPDVYGGFVASSAHWPSSLVYGAVAFVFCFFPLAGFLADVKYGRFKVAFASMRILLVCTILFLVSSISLSLISIRPIWPSIVVGIIIGIISLVGIVGFSANVIQFGMDQLHDSPGEDRILFIHWYVWVYYVCVLIIRFSWVYDPQFPTTFNEGWDIEYGISLFIPAFHMAASVITLCLLNRRRNWFLIEPGVLNPYKLVYRVTKFAMQHKVLVHRSAFTYCEIELPTGLDLAKNKYGGPFTTEQVEDVKVFYGILKVLITFGAVFFIDFAGSSLASLYSAHITLMSDDGVVYNETLTQQLLLNNGLLSPLLIVICIPPYICLLRPFVSRCIPGMLRRMGIGMMLALISVISLYFYDTAAHLTFKSEHNHTSTLCMFSDSSNHSSSSTPSQNSLYLIPQFALTALSHVVIYISAFEFICSQSPHSMKGLLIGLFYAIKGLYQVFASLSTVPFSFLSDSYIFISCGFYYYTMSIVIGFLALLVFMYAAKKYKHRERDEPCNIRRYAEEYYSNPRQELNYDYSCEGD